MTTDVVKILPPRCYNPCQLSEHPRIVVLEQGPLHAVARKCHAARQCENVLEESLRNGRAHAWGVATVSLVTSPSALGVGDYTSVTKGPKMIDVAVCCSGCGL
jgi:hypothetical protein